MEFVLAHPGPTRRYPGRRPMWGPSGLSYPAFEVAQMRLNIDGLAGTTMYQFDGDLAKLGFLSGYDVTTLAYLIRNQGRSAVIGVGGGRDLLSASTFLASRTSPVSRR